MNNYKHKARMTTRRFQILKLIAKGYDNLQIANAMNLSYSNTKLQKWRLYCFLGVHNQNDAILAGLYMGYLIPSDVEVENKKSILKTLKEIRKCQGIY